MEASTAKAAAASALAVDAERAGMHGVAASARLVSGERARLHTDTP